MSIQTASTNMIKQQLRTGDVLEEEILALFEVIPRDAFVPEAFKHLAYSDLQIPLNHDQRMMTPLEEAKVLQALSLKGHEIVLEVGTGSGFLTALLSRLCQKVISVDYFSDLTTNARKKLDQHQINNVELITGDASRGWLDQAPYDVVVFTGAIESVSETHRLQVLPGGKLFVIVGKEPVMQGYLHTLGHDEQWQHQFIFETCIPPLIDKSKAKKFVF